MRALISHMMRARGLSNGSSNDAESQKPNVTYTTAMQLTLKPQVEALLQQELSTGRFQDPNDLIETALHALSDNRHFELSDLDSKIQHGLNDIEQGDVFNEDEARAYIAAMRAKL